MQAVSIDEKICRGEDTGILTGAVFAIKDNICSSDDYTSSGMLQFFDSAQSLQYVVLQDQNCLRCRLYLCNP